MRRYRGPVYGPLYTGDPNIDEAGMYMAMMQTPGIPLKTPYADGDQQFGLVSSYDEEADQVRVISHEGVPTWSGTVDEYYEKWILD